MLLALFVCFSLDTFAPSSVAFTYSVQYLLQLPTFWHRLRGPPPIIIALHPNVPRQYEELSKQLFRKYLYTPGGSPA